MPPRPTLARRRRAPLTRDRILATALALADRHGLEALTMRALGEALSVEAMSLYNHVRGKADLLTGIGDLVLDQIEFPTKGGNWRDGMRAAMRSAWRVTTAHPNVVPLLLGSPADTPGSRALAERVLAGMVPAGFTPAEAHRIFRLVQTYTLGSALMLQRTPSPREVRSMVTALEGSGEFPLLRRALVDGPEIDAEADFEAGIELIMKALPSPTGRPRASTGR
jgi:AcrR family transcriptional regulator